MIGESWFNIRETMLPNDVHRGEIQVVNGSQILVHPFEVSIAGNCGNWRETFSGA